MTLFHSFGQAFGIESVAVALTAGLIAPPAQAMDAPTPAAPATTCTETWNPQGGTCRWLSTTGVNGTVHLLHNADDCKRTSYTLLGWASSPKATPDTGPEASANLTYSGVMSAVWSLASNFNKITYDANLKGLPSCPQEVLLMAGATLFNSPGCEPGEGSIWNHFVARKMFAKCSQTLIVMLINLTPVSLRTDPGGVAQGEPCDINTYRYCQ